MTSKTLTGLEAIKFMEQGGIIIEKDVDEPYILKIENGVMRFKNLNILDGYWMVNTSFDLSLTYEEYIEPKYTNGWKRAKPKESYFAISGEGVVCTSSEDSHKIDDVRYNSANYFSTEEKAKEINFKQMLFRKLQRFSDENGGTKNERKYYIVYNSFTCRFEVGYNSYLVGVGQVHFASKEIAKKCIELFHDDLIKYFTM